MYCNPSKITTFLESGRSGPGDKDSTENSEFSTYPEVETVRRLEELETPNSESLGKGPP